MTTKLKVIAMQPNPAAAQTHEDLLIQLSGAMQRIPEFRAEVQALLADYRTRCLKWLLAAEGHAAQP